MPRLENWYVENGQLHGQIYEDRVRGFPDGLWVTTSPIEWMNSVVGEARTKNTLYTLGRAKGTTMQQKPTVGRTVHYQAYGTPGGEYPSVPRAAIVTQVLDGDKVGLAIMNPTGMFFNPEIPYSETPKPGFWSWPPRV